LNPQSRGDKKAIEAAKEIRGRFLESMSGIHFKILVWGPSEANAQKSEVFKKRTQIRDALREKKQEAFFSEELTILDEFNNPIPVNLAEILHTEYCDLVINIADSPGSLMEAEKFTETLLLKCLVWLRKGESGFALGLARMLASVGRPVLYFDDEDIKSCVMSKASEDWVYNMRMRELGFHILRQRIDESLVRKKGWTQ
jgi:hypothetical protein